MEIDEEPQAKGTENMFNKVTARNFSNLEKGMSVQKKEVFRVPNRQDYVRNSLQHILVKI
jgi:hypothetical protein